MREMGMLYRWGDRSDFRRTDPTGHCLNTNGGPLTLLPFRSTVTSTLSAIFMNGIPLFIPNSLRSKAIVPLIDPTPSPLPATVNVKLSGFDTPRIVNVPGTSNVVGPVCTTLVERNVI